MTKRSENKDKVFLWLSEHKEANQIESLQPLKDAFPDERKQNLSAWRKEFNQKGLTIVKQNKQDTTTAKELQTDCNTEPQTTTEKKEPVKHTKNSSILFKDIQKEPNQPQEIKENCYYTVEQTADLLQVDSSTVYKMIKVKSLPVLNIATTGTRGNYRILGKWILELKPV